MTQASMTKVEIYTDGACSGNPGPGGWGAVLMSCGKTKELSGSEAMTTNNRMELCAIIFALEALNRPCNVKLYSDSAHVINAFEQHWIEGWKRNGWKNKAKADVANKDLWMRLLVQVEKHEIEFIKVKGHADNVYNNRCDELAVMASKQITKEK